MKNFKLIIFLASLFSSFYAKADHASGGYFEYTCLGNNQYLIEFTFLRHCAGPEYPTSVNFSITNSCGTDCGDWTVNAPLFHSEEVQYGCNNGCTGSNNMAPNFQLAKYSATITLPSACNAWTISTVIEWRQAADFGEFPGGIAGQTYYNYCKINNTNQNCNSSVRVTGYPITMGCVNKAGRELYEVIENNNIIDYAMATPKGGYCDAPVDFVYESGASATRPVPSTADYILGPQGQLTYYPTLSGVSFFALKITESENSTNYLGEIVIDGISYSSNSVQCGLGSTVDFSDLTGDNDNTYDATEVDQEYCSSLTLTSNANGEDIVKVSVQAPDYATYDIVYNSDGTATVELCVTFPIETLCQDVDALFIVTASTTDAECLASISGSGHQGYYHFKKKKGLFCPEYLFFTNRSPSGVIMPAYSRAEKYIYVGDSMPPFAPQPVLDNQGPVFANEPIEMVAGINVIIPSCHGPSAGCVQLSAGSTIYLKPNSCSAECEAEEMYVVLDKEFRCHGEKIKVEAIGEAPFTYQWNVAGQMFNTSVPFLDVHDIVSAVDGAQVPYTVTVYDAVGNMGQASGSSWGTKRFYEPIQNNKDWFDYPSGSIFGNSGYYYSANLGVYTDTPAYITDSINSTPPWYGATGMKLVVYDRNSHPIIVQRVDLTGTNDWSMDQGQFYWNGKHGYSGGTGDNNPWGDCHEGDITDIFEYKLFNRNCYQIGSLDLFESDCDEEATFTLFGCLDEEYEYVQTKSTNTNGNDNDNESQVVTGSSRIPERSAEVLREDYFACFPTPMITEFEIFSSDKVLENVRIIDQTGKTLLTFATVQSGQKINVKHLSTGVYVLIADTDLGERRIKLLKE